MCTMDATADRFVLSLPSHPRYLCVLQGFFGNLLADLGFSSYEAMQVTLAVHEACTNIIEHSYQGDTGQRIDLTVLIMPDNLAVEIRDYGSKPDIAAIQPRALQDIRPGGLGTHFIRAIMDSVTYDVSPDMGTVLRMTKRRSEPCKLP
jgi:anti-sigma regulatory factor (Ser/Thr protein kinase)